MEQKEIKPARTFWSAFIAGIIFVFFIIVVMGGGDMLKKSEGLSLVVIMSLGSGLLFGCVFGLFAWVAKRNQKINEKDDLNELMREYLEKKLREEEEKEKQR